MEAVTASKKRMVLAVFLDFILFMVLWGYVDHFAFSGELPFWAGVAVFAAGEAAIYTWLGSPGMAMLSISRNGRVDPHIHNRENWLTLLLGMLFILEGTKQLVRWTELQVPEPLFGVIPDESTRIAVDLGAGALSLVIGYLFLKLYKSAFWLALPSLLAVLVSTALSWPLWDGVVIEKVHARRELQGLPVREGEVEFMQTIIPEGMVLAAVALLIAVLFTYPRLGRPRQPASVFSLVSS